MRKPIPLAIIASLALAAPAAARWAEPLPPVQQAAWNGGGYYNDGYDNRGPRGGYYDGYRGDDYGGRQAGWNNGYGYGDGGWCRRSDGATGTIVGAIAGGALGNVVAGRRDRTTGTIVGAIAGGLLGRSIDRGRQVCR